MLTKPTAAVLISAHLFQIDSFSLVCTLMLVKLSLQIFLRISGAAQQGEGNSKFPGTSRADRDGGCHA
jgi:hypothetical protein